MYITKRKSQLIGALIIAGMASGILSVVPAIDSAGYLNLAAKNVTQNATGAIFQFTMAIIYLAIAALLFPILKKHGESLAIGFLGLRIVATALVIFGTILLASIVAVSQEFTGAVSQNSAQFETLGHVLKVTRDHTNHVYMILALCLGNILMYVLFLKSRALPRWLSLFGLFGIILSGFASILILFQVFDVISTPYLALNAPTALAEISIAIWLLVKGLNA